MSALSSVERQAISGLRKRKSAYEEYFKTVIEPDHQALTAYINILKTMVDIARKLAANSNEDRKSPEEIKRASEEILESEYGVRRT